MLRRNALAFIFFAALLSSWSGLVYAADFCDRACLEGYVDKVIAAMICGTSNMHAVVQCGSACVSCKK